LNISLLNLPSISNPELIDAYETAFSYEMLDRQSNKPYSSDLDASLNLHMVIDFFIKNGNFALRGFYQGFGEMLYNMIISDRRATSEVWIMSVLT
jgi:hypothetical protein